MDGCDGGKEETIITRKPETTIDCAVNCDVDDGLGGMDGWLAEQLDAIYPDRLFAPVFIPTVFDQAMPCDGPNQ